MFYKYVFCTFYPDNFISNEIKCRFKTFHIMFSIFIISISNIQKKNLFM